MQRCAVGEGQGSAACRRRRHDRRNRPLMPPLLPRSLQAQAEPANEMDQLKAVLARAKAAQAKYAHYTQEKVR